MSVIVLLSVLIPVVVAVTLALHNRSEKKFLLEKGVSKQDFRALSWPAQQIVSKFMEIPGSHRPDVDMVSIVSALDRGHGRDEVNEMADNYGYGFSWREFGRYDAASDYVSITKGLNEILDAIREREKELLLSELRGQFDTAKTLGQHLHESAESIREITREVTK